MTAKGVWVLTTNIIRVRYFSCMFMKMYYYISAVNCAAYLFFFLSGLMCRYMSYVMTPQWDQDYWRELQRLEGFFATKFR